MLIKEAIKRHFQRAYNNRFMAITRAKLVVLPLCAAKVNSPKIFVVNEKIYLLGRQ